jgi:hypothetical protein
VVVYRRFGTLGYNGLVKTFIAYAEGFAVGVFFMLVVSFFRK